MLKINWKLVWTFVATVGIPLLYLFNILIAIQPSNILISEQLKVLGVVIALLGIIFWILSYIYLGKSFGVLPQIQKKVKTGLYKYFNHPMYIGISATMIGISIANNSFYGLVFYCLVILPLLIVRARLEEKSLEN